jgi:multidrug efflux pump subunit AcrA (membrane-fusion protein)
VHEGQKAKLTFEDASYEGTVLKPDAKPAQQEIFATVKVALKEAQGRRIGDRADVKITLAQAENAVLVPLKAVETQEDGSETVNVYYGDGLARSRGVITGLTDGTRVQILQGLKDGEKVVVSSHVVETTFYSLLNFEWIVGEKEGPSEDGLVTASLQE